MELLIKPIPPLKKDEENALIRKAQLGSHLALEKLVRAHIKLILKCANKFISANCHLEDLVQEGLFGFLRAVDKFDASKGFRLSTYAGQWIMLYIGRERKNSISIVKVLTTEAQRRNYFKAYRYLSSNPTHLPEHLALFLDISYTEAKALFRALTLPDVSLDNHPRNGDQEDSAKSFKDNIEDEAENPEQALGNREQTRERMIELAKGIQSTLTDNERYVLSNRFLCEPECVLTLTVIGRKLGCSKEAVRKAEERIMKKLKAHFKVET